LTDLKPGTFTPWEDIEANTDLLFYEGLHGLVVDGKIDAGKYVDLGIGVVPVVNLEWIQKIHRDKGRARLLRRGDRGHILRRMPDYVKYVTPAIFAHPHQFPACGKPWTLPNPFIARDIPTLDESFVVIRFSKPRA